MKVTETSLPGVLLIEPQTFGDARGFFMEAYHAQRYTDLGISGPFVQDNVSRSARGVLRGLHYQHPFGQGKLVQVLRGEVFDVAVDIRIGSPNFGNWAAEYLSEDNKHQLYIPPGFAHGFYVTSDDALFTYKCTEFYQPEADRSVRWDDPRIRVEWPAGDAALSARDIAAPTLDEISPLLLPVY